MKIKQIVVVLLFFPCSVFAQRIYDYCGTAQKITLSEKDTIFVTRNIWDRCYCLTPTSEQEGKYILYATTKGSGYVRTINVWKGSCDSLRNLRIVGGYGSEGFLSWCVFYAKSGESYYIYLEIAGDKCWLEKHNDPESLDCTTAKKINHSEDIIAKNPDTNDNWYIFTPIESGLYVTSNWEQYNIVSVYTGSCEDLKTIVNFEHWEAGFHAEAGTTYYINWRNWSDKPAKWKLEKYSKRKTKKWKEKQSRRVII
ncbi:MAG: hypothetical protein FWH23_05340 [Bacteroidales bacterium]|nr:hypothetical protein [Bacteroidales bacterium]